MKKNLVSQTNSERVKIKPIKSPMTNIEKIYGKDSQFLPNVNLCVFFSKAGYPSLGKFFKDVR